MSFYRRLQRDTEAERQWLLAAPILGRCLAGTVTREEYRGFLAQAYHHVRHTVPLLMAVGSRLDTECEWLRRAVADYIAEEYGHEAWVLTDLAAAGGDPEAVRHARPLPASARNTHPTATNPSPASTAPKTATTVTMACS